MPYENLRAYQVAKELLVAVNDARITDPRLRDQALRAAKSVCLNIAEASGRPSPPDQRRVFGIARGELSELVAAVDVAAATGDCGGEVAAATHAAGLRLHALLCGLIRSTFV